MYLCATILNGLSMSNQHISFDMAAETVLRDKANFRVLKGLTSVLLNNVR